MMLPNRCVNLSSTALIPLFLYLLNECWFKNKLIAHELSIHSQYRQSVDYIRGTSTISENLVHQFLERKRACLHRYNRLPVYGVITPAPGLIQVAHTKQLDPVLNVPKYDRAMAECDKIMINSSIRLKLEWRTVEVCCQHIHKSQQA